MSGMRSFRFAMFCNVIVLAFAGCATDTASDGSTGSLSLALAVPGGFEIDEVTWTIRGGDMPDMSDTIDTTAPGSTASVEVFGLPQGTDYRIDMQATSTDGELRCEGSAPFHIQAGEVTEVHVMLNCKRPQRFGAVRVDGTLNLCAELTRVVVSPLRTSVGSSIDLQSAAADEEGDAIAYLWTSRSGQIEDPIAANTTYTCTEARSDRITITVSDDGFDHCMSEWTVPVNCGERDGNLPVFDSGRITIDSTRTDDEGTVTGDVWVIEPDGTQTNLTNSPRGTYSYRGQWSGDGSRIVFYSNRDGLEDIYTMAADGTEVTRVTNDATRDYNASFSPDGELIAWVSHREDENGDIWIANADGSDARALVPFPLRDRTPFFSPDGQRIAFHSYRDEDQAQIFVVDVDGENLTQLTDGDHPFFAYNAEWSPDGTEFLFVSERNGQADIYTMNIDGSGETPVVTDPAPDTIATWSPDGTRILFNSEREGFRQMYIAFRDGTGVQRLEPLSIDEDNFFGIRDWVSAAPSPEVEFVYSELTAGGRPIRYLLDANDQGQMVGSVPGITPGSTNGLDGFVRVVDGTADFWTTPDRLAYPTAISNAGRIVGTNIPIAGGLPEGFQRDAAGNETPYNFPGALGTVPFGISNDDTYSGFYITAAGRRGFVEQASSGLSRSVEFPGAAETQLYGINNRGQAGGAYYDSMAAASPFIYDIASDSFEKIAAPTSGNYVVTSINDAGDAIVFGLRDVTENYADLRSFYRDGRTGVMTELFYPGAVETYGYDIDNQRTIIGYYLDGSGGYGGFRAEIVP